MRHIVLFFFLRIFAYTQIECQCKEERMKKTWWQLIITLTKSLLWSVLNEINIWYFCFFCCYFKMRKFHSSLVYFQSVIKSITFACMRIRSNWRNRNVWCTAKWFIEPAFEICVCFLLLLFSFYRKASTFVDTFCLLTLLDTIC